MLGLLLRQHSVHILGPLVVALVLGIQTCLLFICYAINDEYSCKTIELCNAIKEQTCVCDD